MNSSAASVDSNSGDVPEVSRGTQLDSRCRRTALRRAARRPTGSVAPPSAAAAAGSGRPCSKSVPIAPSGVHAATPSRPPGRSTRASSCAATRAAARTCSRSSRRTTSKLASANGSVLGVALHPVDRHPGLARPARGPASNSSGVRSTPADGAAGLRRAERALPVPHATSSTSSPGRMPAAVTIRGPISHSCLRGDVRVVACRPGRRGRPA